MADPYNQGGGGGPAGTDSSSDYALDQPYDIFGEWSPSIANQINEMFIALFKADAKTAARIVPPTVVSSVWNAVTVQVSAGQLVTLSSAPITIISAPGAGLGFIIGSVSVAVTQSIAGNAGTWRIQASGVLGVDLVTNMPNDLNNARSKIFQRSGTDFGAFGANVTNMRNRAVVFVADADPASAGDATAIVTLIYRTIAWPA